MKAFAVFAVIVSCKQNGINSACINKSGPMTTIIVSLTTIPSRIQTLHKLRDCLIRQSLSPSAIEINIPYKYKNRNFGDIDIYSIPSEFSVFRCDDFGPATKLIPTLTRYKNADVLIIYCDDDRIYDFQWIERLVNAAKLHPDSAICEESLSVGEIDKNFYNPNFKKSARYRLQRYLSLGLYKPCRYPDRSDVAEGFGGALIRPQFFENDIRLIPDLIWFVDDVWISGYLARKKINFIPTNRAHHQRSCGITLENRDIGEIDGSLKHFTYKSFDRATLNFLAVRYFRERYGIWLPEITFGKSIFKESYY